MEHLEHIKRDFISVSGLVDDELHDEVHRFGKSILEMVFPESTIHSGKGIFKLYLLPEGLFVKFIR